MTCKKGCRVWGIVGYRIVGNVAVARRCDHCAGLLSVSFPGRVTPRRLLLLTTPRTAPPPSPSATIMPADPSPPSAPPPPSTVFSLIHELHATVTSSIDTALSWDQLNSPPINYTLVRPIVARFSPHQVESEKRPTAGDGLLDVPRQGAERGPSRAGAGAGAGETGQASLGAILYALMANR